jgi:hypothetical protein
MALALLQQVSILKTFQTTRTTRHAHKKTVSSVQDAASRFSWSLEPLKRPRSSLSNLADELACHFQGDQIGRIFAYWAVVYVGQFSENYRSSVNSYTTFSRYTLCINFGKKWVGLHFGRFFSQTHLVTVHHRNLSSYTIKYICSGPAELFLRKNTL